VRDIVFYSFCLADAVPDDHPIREIAAVLDLRWVYGELAPHYPRIGRPLSGAMQEQQRYCHVIVYAEISNTASSADVRSSRKQRYRSSRG